MASYMKRGKTCQCTISTKDPLTNKFKKVTKGGFRTKAEATSAANEKELLMKIGYILNKKIPFHSYFQEWMELYKKPIVSTRTYTKYETTLNSIKQYFGEKLITRLYQEKLSTTIK